MHAIHLLRFSNQTVSFSLLHCKSGDLVQIQPTVKLVWNFARIKVWSFQGAKVSKRVGRLRLLSLPSPISSPLPISILYRSFSRNHWKFGDIVRPGTFAFIYIYPFFPFSLPPFHIFCFLANAIGKDQWTLVWYRITTIFDISRIFPKCIAYRIFLVKWYCPIC